MKVAIVYDRVNKWGGAERVLLALHEMFPDAPLYTSVYDKKNAKWANVFPKIYTSFLQKIPFAKNNHELLAFLVPMAFEQFNFDEYEIVISVTSEAAKGIVTKPNTLHLCYCLTPTRYLWSGYKEYFSNKLFRFFSKPLVYYLRNWDQIAAKRPDKIIAISTEVNARIKKYYKRNSEIIFPPVSTHYKKLLLRGPDKPAPSRNFFDDAFLVVSRLVKYKKVDLAVKVFNNLSLPLVIIGNGRQESYLKSIAKRNIKFLGVVSEDDLSNYYQRAKALVMPQDEDFGIVSVEAQSYGVPVIAYKSGGALDTVIEGMTGAFFESQTEKSLMQAIQKFGKIEFSKVELQSNAKKFSKSRFKRELQRTLVRIDFLRRGRNKALAILEGKQPKTVFDF